MPIRPRTELPRLIRERSLRSARFSHLEDGRSQFAYPPTPETIRATFRAVKHCTTKGIAINTFMLDASYYLKAFMDEIAKINGGRVFYTTPEKLGEYILVDYVQHKRKRLARRA